MYKLNFRKKTYLATVLTLLANGSALAILQAQKVFLPEVTAGKDFTVTFPALRNYEVSGAFIEYAIPNKTTIKEIDLPALAPITRTYTATDNGGTITFHREGQPDIIHHLEVAPTLVRRKKK